MRSVDGDDVGEAGRKHGARACLFTPKALQYATLGPRPGQLCMSNSDGPAAGDIPPRCLPPAAIYSAAIEYATMGPKKVSAGRSAYLWP